MKNNKSNTTIIVTLSIIIFFLFIGGGFLLYTVLSDNSSSVGDSNSQLSGDDRLPEWITYLSGFDLTLTKSVWSNDQCNFEKISISSDDINKVFQKLSTSKITKYYYDDMPPTGTVCSNRFKLEYGANSISLEENGIVWVNDTTLSNKLDLVVNNTQGSGKGDYVYRFDVDFAEVINNIK